jgi:hypothetical protein
MVHGREWSNRMAKRFFERGLKTSIFFFVAGFNPLLLMPFNPKIRGIVPRSTQPD